MTLFEYWIPQVYEYEPHQPIYYWWNMMCDMDLVMDIPFLSHPRPWCIVLESSRLSGCSRLITQHFNQALYCSTSTLQPDLFHNFCTWFSASFINALAEIFREEVVMTVYTSTPICIFLIYIIYLYLYSQNQSNKYSK